MIPLAIGRDAAEVARRVANARAIFPALPDGAGGLARRRLPRRHARAGASRTSTRWDGAGMQRVLLQMLDQEDIGALELFARDVLPKV